MRKVVITGADGFVGSYTVQQFLDNGISVHAIDINNVPYRLEKHENLTYSQGDVFDIAHLERIIEPNCDTFIHFAWAGSSGDLRANYDIQIRNALNTVECMKLAKRLGCSRFIGAGSIMEYEVEAVMHSQGSRPSLGYIYGIGKHLAHNLCKSVAASIDIDLLWPLITNAYGIGEYSPRFVNNTLRKIINNEQLQFTSANQNYDFVYITDVAEAFYLVAKNGKPFHEYVIGSSKPRPLKEFIIELQKTCAPNLQFLFGDIAFAGVSLPLNLFSTKDIKNDCGFEAKVSFADGTKKTLDWMVKKNDKLEF